MPWTGSLILRQRILIGLPFYTDIAAYQPVWQVAYSLALPVSADFLIFSTNIIIVHPQRHKNPADYNPRNKAKYHCLQRHFLGAPFNHFPFWHGIPLFYRSLSAVLLDPTFLQAVLLVILGSSCLHLQQFSKVLMLHLPLQVWRGDNLYVHYIHYLI